MRLVSVADTRNVRGGEGWALPVLGDVREQQEALMESG